MEVSRPFVSRKVQDGRFLNSRGSTADSNMSLTTDAAEYTKEQVLA